MTFLRIWSHFLPLFELFAHHSCKTLGQKHIIWNIFAWLGLKAGQFYDTSGINTTK